MIELVDTHAALAAVFCAVWDDDIADFAILFLRHLWRPGVDFLLRLNKVLPPRLERAKPEGFQVLHVHSWGIQPEAVFFGV